LLSKSILRVWFECKEFNISKENFKIFNRGIVYFLEFLKEGNSSVSEREDIVNPPLLGQCSQIPNELIKFHQTKV
jgi:hypothetical protein